MQGLKTNILWLLKLLKHHTQALLLSLYFQKAPKVKRNSLKPVQIQQLIAVKLRTRLIKMSFLLPSRKLVTLEPKQVNVTIYWIAKRCVFQASDLYKERERGKHTHIFSKCISNTQIKSSGLTWHAIMKYYAAESIFFLVWKAAVASMVLVMLWRPRRASWEELSTGKQKFIVFLLFMFLMKVFYMMTSF